MDFNTSLRENVQLLKEDTVAFVLSGITLLSSSLVFLLSTLRYPNDDQFILYRYIDNLAEGYGFVYNIGEKVLGSTTPLFTLVATALKVILPTVPTPDLVAYLNISLLTAATFLFYKLCREFLEIPLSVFATLIVIFNLSRTIPEGMETPLFLLTLFGFLLYLFRGHFVVSTIFLSLAVLTRPDAGLIAVLAALYWWQKKGFWEALRLTILSLTVALPWLIFAFFYFGSFVPQSLLTKLHSSDIYNLHPLQAAKIQLASLSRIYWGRIFDPEHIPLQIMCNLLPFLSLAFLGAWHFFRKGGWLLAAIPLVYFFSFSISNPIIFPWYVSQMEPLWILLSCGGVAIILQKIPRFSFHVVLLVLFAAGPLFFWMSLVWGEGQSTKLGAFDAGAYIGEHLEAGERVGLSDIGIVGYVSKAPVVDFIGLVSSSSVLFYPVEDSCVDPNVLYTVPPLLIQTTKPEWLVTSTSQLTPCFYGGEWFSEHYKLVFGTETSGVWRLVR